MIIVPVFDLEPSEPWESRQEIQVHLPKAGYGQFSVLVEVEPVSGWRTYRDVGNVIFVDGRITTQSEFSAHLLMAMKAIGASEELLSHARKILGADAG